MPSSGSSLIFTSQYLPFKCPKSFFHIFVVSCQLVSSRWEDRERVFIYFALARPCDICLRTVLPHSVGAKSVLLTHCATSRRSRGITVLWSGAGAATTLPKNQLSRSPQGTHTCPFSLPVALDLVTCKISLKILKFWKNSSPLMGFL